MVLIWLGLALAASRLWANGLTPAAESAVPDAIKVPLRDVETPAVAQSTAEQVAAANALASMLSVSTPAVRSGVQRTDSIAEMQRRMGYLEPDGRVGPKTRARALALGVELPV